MKDTQHFGFFHKFHGFTTVEILLGVGIFSLILALSAVSLSGLLTRSHLDSASREVTQMVRIAQSNASARYRNSSWGVDMNVIERRITLFAGESYATRNASYDVVENLSSTLALENVVLNGGGSEIIFQRSSGITQQSGSFEIAQNNGDRIRFTINTLGQINTQKL